MNRPKFLIIFVIISNIKLMIATFRRQRITGALIVAIVLSLVAIIFSFLAFAPVLSPFIYPLF